jgi:hypothetical protein
MTPAQPQGDLVFAGSHCHCYRAPQAPGQVHPRYLLVAHADGAVIANCAGTTAGVATRSWPHPGPRGRPRRWRTSRWGSGN